MIKKLSAPLLLVTCYLLLVTSIFAQSPSPATPEEQGIYNLNQSLLPSEIVQETPQEENLLQRIIRLQTIIRTVLNLFGPLLLKEPPNNPNKTYVQSGFINQSNIPPEVIPKDENNLPGILQAIQNLNPFQNKFRKFLGTDTGYYSVTLPQFEDKKSVQESEKFYEKANFPEGIDPITKP